MPAETNRYLKAFRIATAVGIIVNLGFAIPALLAPNALLSLLRLRPIDDPVWLGDAGLLLTFLSLMYIGAAVDPWRYRLNTYLMVIGRLAFVPYWFWPRGSDGAITGYLLLGLGDLAVGVVQLILLLLLLRERRGFAPP